MAKRSTAGETEGSVHKKGKAEGIIARINSNYLDHTGDTFRTLHKIWKNDEHSIEQSEFVVCDPFRVCNLPNFLIEEPLTNGYHGHQMEGCSFVDGLEKELEKLTFHEKNNDLYQFSQSDDLKNFNTPYIEEFRHLLEKDVLSWLQKLTGIELSKYVSMTCSKYEYTDRLLCHDDELDKRRIAFIYYLVPPDWNSEDGGKLDLFSVEENGRPKDIARSIVPCWNSFLFFEVTPQSFHQVSEVLSSSKTRLSINGWFHGTSLPRPPPYMEPIPELCHPYQLELEVLEQWINPMYLDIGVQAQIQQQFEEDSQIELPDFLLEEKYIQSCKNLNAVSGWINSGPPDKRHVIKMADKGHSSSLRLFLSEPFSLLLSHITGLNLSDRYLEPPQSPDKAGASTSAQCSSSANISMETACCHGNVFVWKPGCYTLMSDNLPCQNEFLLEVVLHFNADEWLPEMGGVTSYILKNEDEELLSVIPQNNSLSLVYKDKHTMDYVQYLNNKGQGKLYHSISAVYRERNNQSHGCDSDQEERGLDQYYSSDDS